MDFVKNAMSGGGNNNQQGQGNANNASNQAGGSNQQEDYGDKGLDFIEKKTGHNMGRDTNEKITDGARNMFEKATGKHIDSKYSN
ncbi:hypothetical protein B7463_g2054, partial [Scytalidium lignicola]